MIIIRVMGGLGNQMQQYALYQKFLFLGKRAKLDTSWFYDEKAQAHALAPRKFELEKFVGLPMEIASKDEVRRLTGGDGILGRAARKLGRTKVFEESRMYHPEIFSMDECYLVGYFACNEYYKDIMGKLRDLFVFPKSRDPQREEENRKVLERMHSGQEIPVSIHLRRGDYLDSANEKILGGICTPAYYAGACAYMESAFEKEGLPIHFYVFSDDPAFAKTCSFGTKKEEVTVCDFNTGDESMLDIRLMAACRGNITANSTFSFWGARLNLDPQAVKVRPFYHRNNQVPDPEKMHAYWAGYALVDRDGKLR